VSRQPGGPEQDQNRHEGQTDEFECGDGGFSCVFHALKIIFFRSTCNSAFWEQFEPEAGRASVGAAFQTTITNSTEIH
jgi:hypothetical protein